jgi:hypothetical protein
MSIVAEFPAKKLEPWHAMFRGSVADSVTVMKAARNYGKHIVDCGYAKQFKIIGLDHEDIVIVHCIPHTDSINLLDYWKQVEIDTNTV